MYVEVSHNVQVAVEPAFIPEHSSPDVGYFFFAYRVKIKNLGGSTTQLISRHWIITDGTGRIEEVKGPGVVGDQPRIAPGEEYEYVSACPLPTPTGNMRGSYFMVDENGQRYEVTIPLFFLRAPRTFH